MQYAEWPETLPIERQAERIVDPVARLRFLRKALEEREPPCVRIPAVPYRPARSAVVAFSLLVFAGITSDAPPPAFPAGLAPARAPAEAPEVWLVEKTPAGELYSNGLRVESRLAVTTRPRLYRLQPRSGSREGPRRWQTQPAGILFHASESELAAFVPAFTGRIERQSLGLVEYARRHRLYHYVVDRFGRVHRVVEESDVAEHAGHSVWADAENLYLNLNASFLGVAFEARTPRPAQADGLSPAQVHAGRVLADLLRSRYRIRAENCLTHAQVSVNPFNFYLGFHADWARQFPFASLGLPDNYLQPPAGVSLFGFDYEPALFAAAADSLRLGLLRAGEEFQREAAARNLKPAQWRAALRRQYQLAAAEAARERAALEALARLEVYQP